MDRAKGLDLEYLLRFLAGGLIVSSFAILGDVLRPKSFAGLFGAAPSIALATLVLAFHKQGGPYVSVEGRSMVLGGVALAIYSVVVCHLLKRFRWSAFASTTVTLVIWFAIALGSRQLAFG